MGRDRGRDGDRWIGEEKVKEREKGRQKGNKDVKRRRGKERIKGRGMSMARQGEKDTELMRQWRTQKNSAVPGQVLVCKGSGAWAARSI